MTIGHAESREGDLTTRSAPRSSPGSPNVLAQFIQPIVLPFCFCLIVLLLGLTCNAFQYDTDEGLNLMKSLLQLRGRHLYSEIWSDQPPVFTYVLSGWFKLTGQNVNAARILVLLFSFGLLFSFFRTIQLQAKFLMQAPSYQAIEESKQAKYCCCPEPPCLPPGRTNGKRVMQFFTPITITVHGFYFESVVASW